ncbi:hypothetical protein Plhal304r1_c086g0169451 [Plasmopara halstedii]
MGSAVLIDDDDICDETGLVNLRRFTGVTVVSENWRLCRKGGSVSARGVTGADSAEKFVVTLLDSVVSSIVTCCRVSKTRDEEDKELIAAYCSRMQEPGEDKGIDICRFMLQQVSVRRQECKAKLVLPNVQYSVLR